MSWMTPLRPILAALLAAGVAVWAAVPAGAVHESHHSELLVGNTSQDERIVLRTTSHTRIGIRFRWSGDCDRGSAVRIARFTGVPVDENGRFFKRGRGIGVRGKIGIDPMGNPAFPAPFSFANNEARGRFRVSMVLPDRGRCTTGLVTWDARR
jgi:hypothetical protein